MGQIQFRVRRQPEDSLDTDVDDVVVDTGDVVDGSEHRLLFDDTSGDKADDYPRGQRVEIEVSEDGGGTWSTLDAGAVMTPDETDDAPATVRTQLYDYGFFLRRSFVDRTVSGQTISTTLEEIITNDTPVTWTAGNVTVDNDVTISRSWSGEPALDAIYELAARSNDETFGVNSDFEFVFESQTPSSYTAGDNDIIRYDLPEQGDRALNKVIARFDGDQTVTSEDTTDQSTLKNELAAPRDVALADQITLPGVSNATVAQAKADQWRLRNEPTTRGAIVVPLGWSFDAEPGDEVDVTISAKNITNKTYQIAAVEHRWSASETVVRLGKRNTPLADALDRESNTTTRAGTTLTGGAGGGVGDPHAVPAGETVIVPEDKTATVYGPAAIDGTLTVRGRYHVH